MIYAISDIHGCMDELKEKMKMVDLTGNNRIVFLGDYMDYGDNSYQVLKYLKDLQEKYGVKKVIVLKGNHEQMFLDWLNDYGNPYPDGTEDDMVFNDWLCSDLECGATTISTFLPQWQMDFLNQITRTCSMETLSSEAVQMILSNHEELIEWIQRLPSYFETENQIFVHAGVDEEAGESWMWGTSDGTLLGKFPATKGKFYKTIVAGHVGTGAWSLADDRNYHDVYYDGESHYYIDGSVYNGGKLLLLAYDEENGKYYQIENGKMMLVRIFNKYK